MKIDNIELIKPLLNFSDKGDFYMLYILKRKKDMPLEERDNHQSVRTIKTYCIESVEHLEKRYPEIQSLCELFKARAYIHVQKQNHKDVSLNMMMRLSENIKNGVVNQKGLFDSVVGQLNTLEKRWVVDLDDCSEVSPILLAYISHNCKPYGDKVEAIIPTISGFHLITKRFDVLEFRKQYSNIDIQKKNPTLLFYPDSL
jgi:hypothetical protein